MSGPFGRLPEPKPRFRRPEGSVIKRQLARSVLHCGFLLTWFGIMLVFTPAGKYLFGQFEPGRKSPSIDPLLKRSLAAIDQTLAKKVFLWNHLYPEQRDFLSRKPESFLPESQASDVAMLMGICLRAGRPDIFSQLAAQHPEQAKALPTKLLESVPVTQEYWDCLVRPLDGTPQLYRLALKWQEVFRRATPGDRAWIELGVRVDGYLMRYRDRK
jgi:hypothetical protein